MAKIARKGRRGRLRGTTDATKAHRRSIVIAGLLVVTAIGLVGVGLYAWSETDPAPVRVEADAPTPLGATPLFDPGSTLFVPEGQAGREPTDLGCVVRTADGSRVLDRRSDIDAVGTRVLDEESLAPMVEIGAVKEGHILTCAGPAAGYTGMYVLPTHAGVPRIPLALVVAGIAALGAAALVHPRSRGLHPFGR